MSALVLLRSLGCRAAMCAATMLGTVIGLGGMAVAGHTAEPRRAIAIRVIPDRVFHRQARVRGVASP